MYISDIKQSAALRVFLLQGIASLLRNRAMARIQFLNEPAYLEQNSFSHHNKQ